MGEPVRIVDLAHDLVRLAGRDPDSQPIETVGLRPGEKLHEELFYDAEHVERTESAKVLRANASAPPARRPGGRVPDAGVGQRRQRARRLGQALFDYLRRSTPRPRDGSPEPANGFSDAPTDEADGRPSERPRAARLRAPPTLRGRAIHGRVSAPERDEFLPFARPSITDRRSSAVLEVLDSGWLTTGPRTKAFEEAFAAQRRAPPCRGAQLVRPRRCTSRSRRSASDRATR